MMVHFASLVLLAPLSPLLVILRCVKAPVSPPVVALVSIERNIEV